MLFFVTGLILADLMRSVFVTPTLLRVIRVFRIGRALRLIKAAKGIRKLLFALIISLPALFNIGALLFLIMFIYAIIGMTSFGNLKHSAVLSDVANFETFGNSMLLLFRLCTSAGWNDVLEPLMSPPDDCNPNFKGKPNHEMGGCGTPWLAVPFLTSYILIAFMIIINMYIAIILENFNLAHAQEEVGITEDDIDMFYAHWARFDPHATQFIHFGVLSDFVAGLDRPFQITKPNSVALTSFNIPIVEGDRLHCLDVIRALTKYAMNDVEETEEFVLLQQNIEEKFKETFPTRKKITIVSSTMSRRRDDRAATVIQRWWRICKIQEFINRSRTSLHSQTGAAMFGIRRNAMKKLAVFKKEMARSPSLGQRHSFSLQGSQSRSPSMQRPSLSLHVPVTEV